MLTVDPTGDPLVVDSLLDVSATIAVANSSVNRAFVYEGRGSVDSQGVFIDLQDDTGTSLIKERVNTTQQAGQFAPAVATDSTGNSIIVWEGRGQGDQHGIFFQRFAADGTRLGEETLVNVTTGGAQSEASVAFNSAGGFTIVWSGVGEGDLSGIFMRNYDDAGIAVTDETLVNTTTADQQKSPSLAFDDDDNLAIVWQSRHEDGSDWGVFGQWYGPDGTSAGDAVQLNTTTTASQSKPTIAADPTGGFVAAWQSLGQDGDSWSIVARRFTSAGIADGAEIILNSDNTVGHQTDVSIAIAEDGQWLTAWTSGAPNGAGWEVVSRSFDDNGDASDSEVVNTASAGVNSGNQRNPVIAIEDDNAVIAWTGQTTTETKALVSQNYDVDLVDDGPSTAPVLEFIPDDAIEVGEVLEVTVRATDVNFRDDLTFTLDETVAPDGATIEQIDNNTAIVRWTPAEIDEDQNFDFRVIVTDDDRTPLSDSQTFNVAVGAIDLLIDLNGLSETSVDSTVDYLQGVTSRVTDDNLTIRGADLGLVDGATIVIAATPDGDAEALSVDTTGTSITASYDSSTRTLTLTGQDSTANYQQVLQTLSYTNTAQGASGDRTLDFTITDSDSDTATAQLVVTIQSPDLVAFAQALTDSGASFLGAEWSQASTDQRALFEDGSQYLDFIELTNPDRTSNAIAIANGLNSETWDFGNGTRVIGTLTLEEISEASGVAIPVSNTPTFAEIPDGTLIIGSPLLVSLDGYDPNGDPLTYTVTTSNPEVTAEVFTGNSSARVSVAGYGDMVFELFENLVPTVTQRMIDLAADDFYDDITLHRILNGFVIQGGDPLGNGTGGSTLGDFDDQFHPDLQHNRTGLLSMAKSFDDTNDSQFFITEGDNTFSLRNLDFNHSIFGVLTEGEPVRQSISNTAVNSNAGDPTFPVVMEGIEIFDDTENATLLLKASDAATGPVTITVTVEDSDGNQYEQSFDMNIAEDLYNGRPYLDPIAPVSTTVNTPVQVQLTGTDVEGDDIIFSATRVADNTLFQVGSFNDVDFDFTVSDDGLLTVTPPTDFVGELQLGVIAGDETGPNDTQVLTIQVTAS